MADPFDEIRKIVGWQQREGERQAQAKRDGEQREKAARVKFARNAAAKAPLINSVLEQFAIACWGCKTVPMAGPYGVRNQLVENNYCFFPLHIEGLTATARIEAGYACPNKHGPYFLRINGNWDGSIQGVTIGTYTRSGSQGMIYVSQVELSPYANERSLKEALVRVYKQHLEK